MPKVKYDLNNIYNKIKIKKYINKVIKSIISVILIFLFFVNMILLYYNLKNEKNPSLFGIYFFNIISGSMRPTLTEKDVVIVCNVEENNLKIGDIITFTQKEKIISHRIIKIDNKSEEKRFYTKGDNNIIEDEYPIQYNQIYGKVVFKIPLIGSVFQIIQKDNGIIKTIIMIGIVFVLYSIRDNKKNRRKMLRKKYEIKKKRDNYNISDRNN